MTDTDAQHRKGIALVVAAAAAWSTAPFFTRLLHFDSWTILFWRGLFGGGAIALFLVVTQGRGGVRDLVALAGVAITVSGAEGITDYRGIGLACVMVLAISLMTVVIRRHKGTPMIAAAALSNFLGSAVSLPLGLGIGAVTGADLGVLAMFGACQVGLGLTLFTVGSRLLPSAQASLIATLETPLMPFWVWLAFAEVPSLRALIGGALVMGAVVADIVVSQRNGPARR
ncbi:EamA family transporter [Bradyrhizobium sp. Ce-3]|uniref:EamA family transporter n=1 Tax=Bradyrhizobium sp. Ce-3 TaxID=2913970 RepID=UPI001FC8D59A|nr:EamA family transporter [Bradyrhizobium sp. Ce-3]GKQ52189.1 hypothetical protein BRSPCE3_30440 [Bradyrhizobium sp. Ce-3]